jgi:hypothetical protein
MCVTIAFDAEPHAAPFDHEAIEADFDRSPELQVSHALIGLLPFAINGALLRLGDFHLHASLRCHQAQTVEENRHRYDAHCAANAECHLAQPKLLVLGHASISVISSIAKMRGLPRCSMTYQTLPGTRNSHTRLAR